MRVAVVDPSRTVAKCLTRIMQRVDRCAAQNVAFG